MSCERCGKFIFRGTPVHKGRKIVRVSFCCYECYIAFWADTPNFEPLKPYTRRKKC